MVYDVEVTPEFEAWYRNLDDAALEAVTMYIDLLAEVGPTLGLPTRTAFTAPGSQTSKKCARKHKGVR